MVTLTSPPPPHGDNYHQFFKVAIHGVHSLQLFFYSFKRELREHIKDHFCALDS